MDNNADLSRMIEKLMSDPGAMEMVQKLKQGMLSSESLNEAVPSPPTETNAEKDPPDVSSLISSVAPLLNSLGKSGGADSPDAKRRNQLLSALKPYLSPERQNMIDTFTSLSGMTGILDLLKNGGGADNGK